MRGLAHIQGSRVDDLVAGAQLVGRHFQDAGAPDRIRQDELVAIVVQSPILSPRARQRTIRLAIPAAQTRILEPAGFGVSPAGADQIGELYLAHDARVDLVSAVEVD